MTKLEKYSKIRYELMKKYLNAVVETDAIIQGETEQVVYTGNPDYPYAEIAFKPLQLEIGQERIRYIAEREICRTDILTEKKRRIRED